MAGSVVLTVTFADQRDPQTACAWAESLEPRLERLQTVSSTAAVQVQLEVSREDLRLRLSERPRVLLDRRLPIRGGCAAQSDAILLIIEQQLQDLGYVAPPKPATEPLTMTESATGAAPIPNPEPPRPPRPVTEPEPDPVPPPSTGRTTTTTTSSWHLWLNLGASIEIPGLTQARPGTRLVLSAQRDWLAALLTVAIRVPQSDEVRPSDPQRGRLSVWSWAATLGGEACYRSPAGDACGGLRAGVEVAHGTSEGELLFRAQDQSQVAPLLVAAARYRYVFGGRWAAWIAGEGIVRPSANAFSVEGGRVLENPTFAFSAAAGISVRFF